MGGGKGSGGGGGGLGVGGGVYRLTQFSTKDSVSAADKGR